MFTTIALIVILAIAVAAFVAVPHFDDEDTAFLRTIGGILTAIFLIWGGLSMTYYVSATEVAVPISFGHVGSPVGPGGLHVKAPWVSVESLPVRPFPVNDIDVPARTAQGGSVTVKVGARWQVIKDEANRVYLQVRTGDEEKISSQIVDKALGTAVRNEFVTLDNSSAVTASTNVEGLLKTELNRILAPYGIQGTDVFLRQVEPDQGTSASLSRLASAKNDTAVAQQQVLTAQQNAAAAKAAAAGAQEATAQIPANLTPQQVQIYCANLWSEAQAAASKAGQTLYTTPCQSGSGAGILVSPGK